MSASLVVFLICLVAGFYLGIGVGFARYADEAVPGCRRSLRDHAVVVALIVLLWPKMLYDTRKDRL